MCLIDKYVVFVYITHVFNRQVCFISIYNPCVLDKYVLFVHIAHVFIDKYVLFVYITHVF